MSAWKYFESHGLVTGGQFNTSEGCQPYSIAACDHHVVGHLDPCSGEGSTPKCKTECEAGYPKTYKADKHFGKINDGRSSILIPPNTTRSYTRCFIVLGAYPINSHFITCTCLNGTKINKLIKSWLLSNPRKPSWSTFHHCKLCMHGWLLSNWTNVFHLSLFEWLYPWIGCRYPNEMR